MRFLKTNGLAQQYYFMPQRIYSHEEAGFAFRTSTGSA